MGYLDNMDEVVEDLGNEVDGGKKAPLSENKLLILVGVITAVVAVPLFVLKWVKGENPSDVIAVLLATVSGIMWAKTISTGKKKFIRWTVIITLLALSFAGFVLMDMFRAI
ncbi:MAG: hypothetical protein Q4C42_05775 [Clostridia bacterium]|nr:hypothetical protein [Clostridia bacterium]